MSKFVTKLLDDIGRDGIDWPTTVGTWQQGDHVRTLETFAKNLDVSQSLQDTDLLNSVPTPWARLLLFESALYKEQHPSHRDIEDQWRGLLGVLALARPLNLNVEIKSVSLNDVVFKKSRIANTFSDLRPKYQVGDVDVEAGKWNDFQMIVVDRVVLGATSPRTLVFTGVAHQCPSSIPFRSPEGRLSDPIAYYKQFGDTFYVGLLLSWIQGLKAGLEGNEELGAWMGYEPAAKKADARRRITNLIERLDAWTKESSDWKTNDVDGEPIEWFAIERYKDTVRGLPGISLPGESDLYLKGHTDLMFCFRPDRGSILLNSNGQEVVNERIKIYDGRWIRANQPLPLPFTFLAGTGKKVKEDPRSLFEDRLIEVKLPKKPEGVYYLEVGDEVSSKRYLFPFKPEILDYGLTPELIAANTQILPDKAKHSLRVDLRIPLVNNRTIKVSRNYSLDTEVIVDALERPVLTAQLAAWPDFVSTGWNRYFYFKSKPGDRVDFRPISGEKAQEMADNAWYVTAKPVTAFIGSINNKNGLLLLRHTSIEPPNKFWKLGVDFGSTHTRAFSLLVEKKKDGKGYIAGQVASIEPIVFSARGRELTDCQATVLAPNFLAMDGSLKPPQRKELKTLLMMPEPYPKEETERQWIPYDGFIYMHWILLNGRYDPDRLRFDLKWDNNRTKYDLRAYLHCLLTLIQAEAVAQRAQIVSVSHAYPSSFTATLETEHQEEWDRLGKLTGLEIEDATLSEAVVTARYLAGEERAPTISNTISLDIGGSTTDIAIWSQDDLKIQESVRMAAGIVGDYLQSKSASAEQFLKWLQDKMHDFNVEGFSLDTFASKPSGYSLMFYDVLTYFEMTEGLDLDKLVKSIKTCDKADTLLSHITFLFGGLLYYAGLLARKVKLPQKKETTYYLYFCGKGGTLIKWVHKYKGLAEQMFLAGLFGPTELGGKSSPSVELKISEHPKEEVGRGLLVESKLEGKERDEGIGLRDLTRPSVTVGENGYSALEWDGKLDDKTLSKLQSAPSMGALTELSTFVKAFREVTTTRFDFASVNAEKFHDQLRQRLFGKTRGGILHDIKEKDPDALVEPLFMTELKVLLEMLTQNSALSQSSQKTSA